VNSQARGGGNSNCRWTGILIIADQEASGDSCTLKAKPPRTNTSRQVSAIELLLATINSQAGRVCRKSAWKQSSVNPHRIQQGMMIDVKGVASCALAKLNPRGLSNLPHCFRNLPLAQEMSPSLPSHVLASIRSASKSLKTLPMRSAHCHCGSREPARHPVPGRSTKSHQEPTGSLEEIRRTRRMATSRLTL
jgi:hypothetical protein